MAQAKRKSSSASGGKKTGSAGTPQSKAAPKRATSRTSKPAGTSRTPRSGASAQAQGTRQPRRREIAAGICFLLGVFSFIGYFDASPVFIGFFTGFVMRLIGHGFYALAPALIMCSVILAFHKGYPVMLRTISTLGLAAIFGALWHILVSATAESYELSFSMLGALWTDGADLKSGGIIAGGITELFWELFGGPGTIITYIIIAAILGLIAFNATVSGLIGAFSNREKRYYDIEYNEDETDDGSAAYGTQENDAYRDEREALMRQDAHRRRFPLFPWGAGGGKKKAIDIPIDERRTIKKDFFAEDPKDELYDKTPGATPPDEILRQGTLAACAGNGSEDGAARSAEDDGQRYTEDMPFDIPFIDEKWHESRMPEPVTPPIESVDFLGHGKAADLGLPPDVIEQVTHPRKRKLPVVPEPEGPGAGAVYTGGFNEPAGGNAGSSRSGSRSGFDRPGGYSDGDSAKYRFPSIDLLSSGDTGSRAGDSEVSINSERLEAAFQSFGINVSITNATRGPSVTRYEAELEAGIKLSRLTGLADDIALALGTIGVRIAAMPNKRATVGIEVPNKNVSKVHLRDIIESAEFSRSQSKLSFAIGMDITGEKVVGDISKLPHLLIAGTTGSGKSVCLNSIILSLLYKAAPDDVRLIMIDPKLVEFKVYANIPHLLVPLVTEAKKAAGALQWATFEMMKRYNLFSEANARDIEGYNRIAGKSNEEMQPLPRVVVIIDELADLMLTAAKEVEESVCRIAQMGRAAGIHLVIATQSPRANVITGLMKANIPSRIAFKVASALESQIILDPGQNADKLIGNGDMLYSPTGILKPLRVQGTWVSDKEREKVVESVEKMGAANFDDEAAYEIDKLSSAKGEPGPGAGFDAGADSEYDELLPQAVEVIFETGQASVSMLQRRLKLGYARAARIVDQMEEMGIVGAYEGSKPRGLLITRDQWLQMQYINGTAPPDIN